MRGKVLLRLNSNKTEIIVAARSSDLGETSLPFIDGTCVSFLSGFGEILHSCLNYVSFCGHSSPSPGLETVDCYNIIDVCGKGKSGNDQDSRTLEC